MVSSVSCPPWATTNASSVSNNAMMATAESCTGGLIAGACTEISGSSDWFERGFVTYSNAAKIDMLGVRAATLAAHGAVSEAVAAEMAAGALARADAQIAMSVTGIAGPGGSDRSGTWSSKGLENCF